MVQAPDNVHLGATVVISLLATSDDLIVAHDVTLGVPQIGAKGTKTAPIYTDILWVQMRVDVVVPNIAAYLLSLPVGQLPNRMQRNLRIIQKNPIIEIQASPLLDFVADVLQSVFDLQTAHDSNGPL